MRAAGLSSPEQANFRAFLAEYIQAQAQPVEKFGHQPRLYRLTQAIGKDEKYDDDVVYAAAWLHDLGVFVGHRPEEPAALAAWDNVRYAVEQAPAVLQRAGFPQQKVAAVLEAIRTHQPSASPIALEGILLRDADILEQLGSVGILRVAAKVGRDTRFPTFTNVVETLKTNLAELPAKLRLKRAKEMAGPRVILLQSFLDEIDAEAQEDLF
jgi:uncharacterized protein